MAYILNDKIRELSPYQPITGSYKIRLDANESYMTLSPDKLCGDIFSGLNRYPDPYALKLCEGFAKYYGIDSRYVTAGNGSDELIALLVEAFFTADDTLLTLSSDFSMYRFYGEVSGVKLDTFQKEKDLTVDTDKLASYINSSGAAGVIFSNPCNPTSLCLEREQVLSLVEGVRCLVILDEAYMDFAGLSVLDVCHKYDNLIVLKTCSKAIGMAGIRLGFAIANERLTNAIRAVKSPYNVNAITQRVGEMAFENGDFLRECTKKLIESRIWLYNALCELNREKGLFKDIYSSTTNFLYIDASGHAGEIYSKLLEKSIAIRCMGEHLRITAGSKEENETLVSALYEICDN